MGILRNRSHLPTSRRTYAARGLLLLGVLAGLLALVGASLSGSFTESARVTVTLDTAGGSIVPGSDVKMRGLVVGSVASVGTAPGGRGGVEVSIDLESDALGTIPGNVRARVLPATVFGTSYVDLTVPAVGASNTALRAGDTVPQDVTVPTLELQQALDSIDGLVDALGPAELATALTSLSTALDGRGEQIGLTAERLDRLLREAEPLLPLARTDLRLLRVNLETLEAVAPQLLDTVEDTLVVTDELVLRRAQLTALLSGGLDLVGDVDRLLTDNEMRLLRAVRGSAGVVDALHDERAGISGGIVAITRVTDEVPTITDGGQVAVLVRLVAPSDYYTAADCPRYQGRPGRNCGGAGEAR